MCWGSALERRGMGQAGEGRVSKDVVSAGDWPQLIPGGALEHKLHHRVGPSLRPGGQPFVSPVPAGPWLSSGEAGRGHSLFWPRPSLLSLSRSTSQWRLPLASGKSPELETILHSGGNFQFSRNCQIPAAAGRNRDTSSAFFRPSAV